MLPLVFVVILAVVEGEMYLDANFRGRELDIKCSVNGLPEDAAMVSTLSILRRRGRSEDVLALVPAAPDRSPDLSHDLGGGDVTYNVDRKESSVTYINIHWSSPSPRLNDRYRCYAEIVMKNATSTSLQRILDLQVPERLKRAASNSSTLTAVPHNIEVGVTPTLNIRCSISDLSALNLFSVTQIEISFLQSGVNRVLASIDVFDGKIVNPAATMDFVTGDLGTNKENYLNLKWQSPDLTVTGTYTCDIAALSQIGRPVQYHYAVNVTAVELTRDELELKVQQLKAQLDNVNNQNQLLTSQNKGYVDKIRVMEESLKGHKLCDDVNLPVGQYEITLFPDDGVGLIKVICDVIGPGDVWTVFHRRYDGSVNFTRRYSEYDSGFGSLDGEFWLGLNRVWRILFSVPGAKYKLRVDLVDYYNVSHTRVYPTFDLGPSSSYVLTASGYDDKGRGLSFNSGSEFSTFDHGPQTYCAVDNGGGWWYDNCAFANLNGRYGEAGPHGMKWYELPSSQNYPLKAAQMKFKKN